MKDFLSQIHSVDDAVLEEYLSHWKPYGAPKRTIMTAPGETERHLYFVMEGIQKSYYLHDDKQHVIAFTYPPSFSGIPESFLTQTPSKYFLETITASQFIRISYEKHQQLMQEHRPIETLFRKATEYLLIGMIHRHYELMAYDIETRFKAFTQRSSHLLNILPQKDIASYLRIDPTNLSKLLNNVKI
ncbi:Crp/Fnr family transcriptional regulator [Marinoscillum sp. MHG1-6]|uniref:Crp/Fnr family transcriptional regulator n=1 Tax=Marinoscillum sp. MHG1-6 TaxID=2959627 RepID=UPI002157E576|nr:Crp/Fnr family transcriptional regulator [Marinoscillum sp. MHG1-6]